MGRGMGKGSRRARRAREGHPQLDESRARGGAPRRVEGPDGQWFVRHVAAGERPYVCPGCNQEVAVGSAHVVVWPADDLFGDESGLQRRRHWHSACWNGRLTRH